jgi:phosphoenolpyruvate carboxykinase (ATP)
VPQSCEGVPKDVLNPASSWPSKDAYMDKYKQLAARFIDNFKKFADQSPEDVRAAGPKI